jgi:hypothetical protein
MAANKLIKTYECALFKVFGIILRCSSGGYALKKVSPGLRVSDVETLSWQKSAKNGKKNPQLASLRQVDFSFQRRFLPAKSF